MTVRLRLWLPVALWAGLIFLLSSLPDVGPRGDTWAKWLARKGAHVFEYAVLSFLLRRALEAEGLRRAGAWAFAGAVLYAASDEWHQTFVPGRDGKAADVLIDALGALAAFRTGRR